MSAAIIYIHIRLRWSRGSVLDFSTQVCGFKPGRSLRIFRAKRILSSPSLGGEVKPSVPCRRFAACKRSGKRNSGKITPGHLSRPQFHLSLLGSLVSLRTEARLKAGESKGKLPPRTCPGCSVPGPYRSHDWALVPAKPGLQG